MGSTLRHFRVPLSAVVVCIAAAVIVSGCEQSLPTPCVKLEGVAFWSTN